MRTGVSGLALVACMMAWPGDARAQTQSTLADRVATPADSRGTPSGQTTLGDIVVTAQRRSESLQKTSITVEVLSSELLSQKSVTTVQDLTRVLPGVQISTLGPGAQVFIRGVGDYGSTAVSSPAVPFNVDGVYIARNASLISDFFDVDRVEVLKGPQGTLYGRNSSGGNINVITRKPKLGIFEGNFSAELGNFDTQVLEGGVSVPLGSNLAVRLAGQYVHKNGFTQEGNGDDKHHAVRLQALWSPNSSISLRLSGTYGKVGGRGPAFVITNPYPGNGKFVDAASPQGNAYVNSVINAEGFGGLLTPPLARQAMQDSRFWNLSAEFNADLGFATLTVLPAYRDAEIRNIQAHTFLYPVGLKIGDQPARPETSRQTSVEVRLAQATPQLKWVLGAYFYNEDQYSQNEGKFGLLQDVGHFARFGTRSYSAFGQTTITIAPALRLIGGLRYTSDRRSLTDGRLLSVNPAFGGGCIFPVTAPTCLLSTYAGQKTFHNLSWKGGVEYDLAPDSLLYATVSSGFKAGGYNEQVEPTAPITSHDAYLFNPEKLIAYEVGLKTRFLDNRLQLNLEGFYWDYRDHQEGRVSFDSAGNTTYSFDNAGKARVYGGSIDLLAKPWRGARVHAGVEYANSRYSQFDILTPAAFVVPGVSTGCRVSITNIVTAFGPLANLNCAGFEIVRAPRWSGTAGFSQAFELASGSSVEASVDMTFASPRWISPEFISPERAPSYQTVDVQLTFRPPGAKWSLTAFGRNLTNEQVLTGGFIAPFIAPVTVATTAPPRTYGARLSVNF